MDERVFHNRYRIERRLGDGGMAIVYCGTDALLRRRVAVKVLREQFARDDEFVKRFYVEAQNAARLSHPNIVNVYDVGREGDDYYIVMELVDGETLAGLIAANRIPEPVAIDYATQITSGLAYAHRQGLLHRDIKPANILVTKDDVVKLSDFGIARAVSQHTIGATDPGMVMGSVYYISPEQAQGHDIDESSDLYSLGVVLYQMALGKLPYTGDSPVTVALKHVSEPVPPIDPDVAQISPALASIIEKLLQKNPRDRYRSATELATALREAREQPMVAHGAVPGAVDDATMMIPKIEVPPPRRSQAPDYGARDRPPRADAAARAAVATPLAAGRSGRNARVAIIAAIFALAVIGGYAYFGRHGSFLPGARSIALANFAGMSSARAQQQIVAAGLQAAVHGEASETVARDRVIRQTPAAATKLRAGDMVELVVSEGLPSVEIPEVKGARADDAIKKLRAAKFHVKQFGKYSNTVAAGIVMNENPPGRTRRIEGSAVALTISKGTETAVVPDLVASSVDSAQSALAALHLKLRIAERQPSDTIPQNAIESQDPKAGQRVAAGTQVAVYVSSGVAAVVVPNLGTKNQIDATAALNAIGLTSNVTYSVQPNDATGTVMRQDPPASTKVKRGTPITITIAVTGIVPDVAGLSLNAAKAALQNAGYAVGNTTETQEGREGTVVRTEPAANTQLSPLESVVIYYNGQVPGNAGGAAQAPPGPP